MILRITRNETHIAIDETYLKPTTVVTIHLLNQT